MSWVIQRFRDQPLVPLPRETHGDVLGHRCQRERTNLLRWHAHSQRRERTPSIVAAVARGSSPRHPIPMTSGATALVPFPQPAIGDLPATMDAQLGCRSRGRANGSWTPYGFAQSGGTTQLLPPLAREKAAMECLAIVDQAIVSHAQSHAAGPPCSVRSERSSLRHRRGGALTVGSGTYRRARTGNPEQKAAAPAYAGIDRYGTG